MDKKEKNEAAKIGVIAGAFVTANAEACCSGAVFAEFSGLRACCKRTAAAVARLFSVTFGVVASFRPPAAVAVLFAGAYPLAGLFTFFFCAVGAGLSG